MAEEIFNLLVKQPGEKNWCLPYSYKIKKNHLSYRTLSVLHPASQWRIAEFYRENNALIVHYTSRSSFSIRAPRRVAGSYYVKEGASDLSKFKRSQVALAGVDRYLSRSPSYFAYRGYGRLYKFFDSGEFLDLEEKFQHLWMLDVAKCFDSIYTHTLLWAVKDKPFAKEYFSYNSFGESFDRLMQESNYGETSGIVIGPESSRIFAEIIMQEVDVRVALMLRNDGLNEKRDYQVWRYVDDFFVFANDAVQCAVIYSAIESVLAEFKLGINEVKVQRHARPFLTKKSKTILEASKLLTKFAQKFTAVVDEGRENAETLAPTKIYKADRLFISFCNDVKMCCATNSGGYDEVSGYLIASLKNRAAKLMTIVAPDLDDIKSKYMFDALVLIIRSMFFLYSVAPSVSASYRLATTIIMVFRYGGIQLKGYSEALKVTIFAQVSAIIEASSSHGRVTGFVDLETQNLILAVSEYDDDFRLDPKLLERVFVREDRAATYFNLATAMFYIKNFPGYSVLRKWVCESVDRVMNCLGNIKKDTECALIALDFIGCPYIELSRRETWAKLLLKSFNLPSSDPMEIGALLSDFESLPWFIDWREIDLLNLLERKELRSVY